MPVGQVLNICNHMLDEVVGEDRAPRDFRAKFPDDVLQENLAGQLWFGAEVRTARLCDSGEGLGVSVLRMGFLLSDPILCG